MVCFEETDAKLKAQEKTVSLFLFKFFTMGAILAAIIVSIVFLIPDENDYSKASVSKHRRLSELPSPKIVLVGGSNLSFGVDSPAIENALQCPVVNMGMNGWLGIRYMLAEVRDQLRSGDTAVLSFEWDNFFKSVEGHGPSFLGIVKANPAALSHLTLQQSVMLLRAFGEVSQTKTQRILKEFATKIGLRGRETQPRQQRLDMLNQIEAFSGFSLHGDLVSHLNVPTPLAFPIGEELIASNAKVESRAIELIHAFAREMKGKNVEVVISYPPIPPDVYGRHSARFNSVHDLLSDFNQLSAPQKPSAYIQGRIHFFDTIYHLNQYGRPIRTQSLIEDLLPHSSCPHSRRISEMAIN